MQIKKYHGVFLHLLINSLTIISAVRYLAQIIRTKWAAGYEITIPFWAYQPAVPKLDSILEYLMLLVAGGVCVVVFWILSQRESESIKIGMPAILLFIAFEWSLYALLSQDNTYIGGLVLLLVFPFWLSGYGSQALSVLRSRLWLSSLSLLLVCMLALLVATSWSPKLQFTNDYSILPTWTKMSDGSEVNSAVFAQQHHLDLLKINDAGVYPQTPVVLDLPRNVFKNISEPFWLFPPTKGVVYDWEAQQLRMFRGLTMQEKLLVQSLWGIDAENWRPVMNGKKLQDQAISYQLGGRDSFVSRNDKNAQNNVAEQPTYAPYVDLGVSEFLQKNRGELIAQTAAGQFFYHHAYLYLPVLENVLADRHTIPAQYGQGLVWSLGKFLKFFAQPSFENYFHFLWGSLYTYLLLLAIVIWLITKDVWMTVFAVVLAVNSILLISVTGFRMAPGYQPIRHLPDLLCFAALFYDRRRHSYFSGLSKALLSAFFVWWNREFGLFFFAAGVVWYVFEMLLNGSRWRRNLLQILCEMILVAIVLLKFWPASGNDLAALNLMGVGSNLTLWATVLTCLSIWALLIGGVVFVRFSNTKLFPQMHSLYLLDIAGIGALYGAFSTVYYLWNPSINSAAVIFIIGVVPLTACVAWLFGGWTASTEANVSGQRNKHFLVLVAILFCLASFVQNMREYIEYKNVYAQHRLFEWNFPGLKGVSDADPDKLQQSVNLIKRYAPEGRLTLISRYDNLFLMVMSRLPVFPYVDLTGAAVSEQLVNGIAAEIMASASPVIFVDRDLLTSNEDQIPTDALGHIGLTEALRVGTKSALAQVFLKVKPCFSAGSIEGELQVWNRTCRVEKQ